MKAHRAQRGKRQQREREDFEQAIALQVQAELLILMFLNLAEWNKKVCRGHAIVPLVRYSALR
jgi:hypothetical protein